MKIKELDLGMGIVGILVLTAIIYGLSLMLNIDFKSLLVIFYGWFSFRYFLEPSKKDTSANKE